MSLEKNTKCLLIVSQKLSVKERFSSSLLKCKMFNLIYNINYIANTHRRFKFKVTGYVTSFPS